jgi:prepilin-type N-terminal cleavage/methylation domain-containing protein
LQMSSTQKGVTLIELVMVIIILSILAAALVPSISHPFLAYLQQKQRYQMSNQAQLAMDYLKKDSQHAISISIKVFDQGTRLRFIKKTADLINIKQSANPQTRTNRLYVISQDTIQSKQGLLFEHHNKTDNDWSVIATTIKAENRLPTNLLSEGTCAPHCPTWQHYHIQSKSESLPLLIKQQTKLMYADTIVDYQCEDQGNGKFTIQRWQHALVEANLSATEAKKNKSIVIDQLNHCLFQLSEHMDGPVLVFSFTHQRQLIGEISLFSQILFGRRS